MTPRIRLLFLALAFASGAYAADEVYRSVMPDGRIIYGETVAPGAKSYKKVPSPPSGVTVVTPAEMGRANSIQTQGGGVAVIPQQPRTPPGPAIQGGGATYGTGPGPLPKPAY